MKDVQLIAYSMVHEYLMGRPPSAKTYNDRIVAQKIGYLTQSVGIHLGDNINYFWHKRGPYSRVLTSMLFKIEDEKEFFKEQSKRLVIKKALKPKLDFVKEIIEHRPQFCSEVYWLEIAASLMFISKEHLTIDKQNLKGILLKRKPFLNEYSEAIDKANDILFNCAKKRI